MIMWNKDMEKRQNYIYGYKQLCSLQKTKVIYADIAKDFEARFVTLNYE